MGVESTWTSALSGSRSWRLGNPRELLGARQVSGEHSLGAAGRHMPRTSRQQQLPFPPTPQQAPRRTVAGRKWQMFGRRAEK